MRPRGRAAMQNNRRRFDRVHLTTPLPAKIGGGRGFILDVSLSGFRVAHQHLVSVDTACVVEVEWQGDRAVIDCRVIRTHAHRASTSRVYHTGLEMLSSPATLIRELIEWHVLRALDEQKANARGVPPVAAQSVQTGGGRDYVRHEWMGSDWRALPTSDPRQPRQGFTVAAATTAEEVAMLRQTFEQGDRTAREMLRKMAEMSISSADGIPTRKYTP
ncbi:MAG TPA: PilZ domain-containing protein [Thermoanaerobaculia bacterium]|nr:PilZ domain-containing protein [Thermoanaerobaculia bacterium]